MNLWQSPAFSNFNIEIFVARKATSKEGTILLPNKKATELVLTYAGNIIKHLGVQMYSGRPVPAIAELISNAWDADATKVDVEIPTNEAWDPLNSGHRIVVSDNGNGMSWDMVKEAYLDVGRDRRESEGTDLSPGGRPVQGRKGVGKLAGFGVADVLEVQTVHKNPDPDVKAKVLIWFTLIFADLKKAKTDVPVKIHYAGPVKNAPEGKRRTKGTTITLKLLHARKAQNLDRFHRSMAQRFVLSPQFRVRINKEALRPEDIKLQIRYPEKPKEWATEEIPGCGLVHYWIGFTPQTRKQNEGDLSGILIYTRSKVSQEATFFEISGGVTGQHGLRYMVGMIKAEWLDSRDKPDFIATHRGAIAWESSEGVLFKKWGQQLVKSHLTNWAKIRTKQRAKQIEEVAPEIKDRINKLSPAYKDAAMQFVERFKAVEMEVEEFQDIVSWFLDALENATLRSILQKLKDADAHDLGELDQLLSRMEIRTAVSLLQVIDSNLAAIETLERMSSTDAKERGVLSKHIESNPWLIDPTWILSKAEGRVATWLKNKFKIPDPKDVPSNKRADFFCIAVGGTVHIVEIKRGKHVAKAQDFLQADKYREYVIQRFTELTDPKAIQYSTVQSHLIADSSHMEAKNVKEMFASNGHVFFTTWDDLIERAKVGHQQFRKILEKKVYEETPESFSIIEKKSSKKRMAKKSPSKKRSKKASAKGKKTATTRRVRK